MEKMKDKYIYSFNQLATFLKCPYSFYLENIEKESTKSNIFEEQSILIHDLLDIWASHELDSDDLLQDEYCQKYSHEIISSAPKSLVSRGIEEKLFNLGHEYLKNFDNFYGFEIIRSSKKYIIELNDFLLKDTIDLVCKDIKTEDYIIIDHDNKSLSEFKENEDLLFKRLYLHSKCFYEDYGFFPKKLIVNLFNEGGTGKIQEFNFKEYIKTIDWAIKIIERIESFNTMDFISECKEKTKKDYFFCENICNVRKHCPNGDPENKPIDFESKSKKGKKK